MTNRSVLAGVLGALLSTAAFGQVDMGIAPPPPSAPTILPPTPAAAANATAPAASPAPAAAAPASGSKDTGPLSTFKPNQEATEVALLGYVNSEPVFTSELFRIPEIDDRLKRMAVAARSLGEFQKGARDLLERRVQQLYGEALIQSAADAALTADERSRIDVLIDTERTKLITRYGGSAASADKALRAEGSSLAAEVNRLKREFKTQLYFQRTIVGHIQVTRDMALAAYEKTPDQWKQKAQLQVYTLTIPISRWLRQTSASGEVGPVIKNATPEQVRAAEAEAEKTAREIIAKLRASGDKVGGAGGEFARLVEEYNSADPYKTDGGKAKLTRGSLRDTKWEDYLFSLPEKSIQEPYIDRNADYEKASVVVIMTGEKLEARTIPFKDVQQEIIRKMREAQFVEMREKKMRELAATAAVEAIDRMLEVAVNAAVSRYAMK